MPNAKRKAQFSEEQLNAAVAAAVAKIAQGATGATDAALPKGAAEVPPNPPQNAPTNIRQCIITIDHKGTTIDVATVPLVTGKDVIAAGSAMVFDRNLAYNVLNGITSPEVNDTSNKQVWGGIPNASKNAFRKLRHFMQSGKSSAADDAEQITQPHNAVQWLRDKWEAYVAEKVAENNTAKAEGKKTVYRVRPLSLQVLSKFLKGKAPKGGGITGMRDKVRKHVETLKKALAHIKVKDAAVTAAIKALEAEVAAE